MIEILKELVLNDDLSETFYPNSIDLETVKRHDCEYVMGRLPNGDDVVKSITYFGGCNTTVESISISLKRLRNQHKKPFGCD